MNADKTCEKCNTTVTYKNWARHLKTQKHLENDPFQTIKSGKSKIPMWCKKCKVKVISNNWSRHLQSKQHAKNDSKQPKPIKRLKYLHIPFCHRPTAFCDYRNTSDF